MEVMNEKDWETFMGNKFVHPSLIHEIDLYEQEAHRP